MTRANPQGKGLVPLLEAWHSAQPVAVKAKSEQHILADYFTSLLVLSAEFAFKPRPGVRYHLYLATQGWQLSLISPNEWGSRIPGPYLGRARLRADMTWQIEVDAAIDAESDMAEALDAFQEGFRSLVAREGTLEANLPFYRRELPYYRRLAAAGLSSSLARSVALSGLGNTSGKLWLDRADRVLLEGG